MNVYLVRHGESEANVDQKVYDIKPNIHIELTEKGVQQAKELGQNLLSVLGKNTTKKVYHRKGIKYDNIPTISIVSSSYRRAIQTTEQLSLALEAKYAVNPLIIERLYGEATGYTMEEYLQSDPYQAELYKDMGELLYNPPQGESKFDVIQRGIFFKSWIERQNTVNLIVVAHKEFLTIFHNDVINQAYVDEWANCCCRKYVCTDKGSWIFKT